MKYLIAILLLLSGCHDEETVVDTPVIFTESDVSKTNYAFKASCPIIYTVPEAATFQGSVIFKSHVTFLDSVYFKEKPIITESSDGYWITFENK